MTEPTEEDPAQLPVLRLLKAQREINALTTAQPGAFSDAKWLRRMAELRRELAGIYLAASDRHDLDTIEWHALREAALMHQMNATSNEILASTSEPEDITA